MISSHDKIKLWMNAIDLHFKDINYDSDLWSLIIYQYS